MAKVPDKPTIIKTSDKPLETITIKPWKILHLHSLHKTPVTPATRTPHDEGPMRQRRAIPPMETIIIMDLGPDLVWGKRGGAGAQRLLCSLASAEIRWP